MNKCTLIAGLLSAALSSTANAGAYADDLDSVYRNAQSHWSSINSTNKGKFHGVSKASLKDSHLWGLLIQNPKQTNYLRADNSTYRLRFNTTGPETAQVLRGSPDANLKGYLVGY